VSLAIEGHLKGTEATCEIVTVTLLCFWSKGCILDGPLVNHVGFHAAVFLGFGQGISVA